MLRSVGLLLILLQCIGSFAQTIDLTLVSATPGIVTEGTDTDITIECSLPGGAAAVDSVCSLELDAAATTDAENGYDFDDITGYSCIISAGATMGTVDIPLINDLVMEATETLVVTCATPVAVGTPLSITIMDDGDADQMVVVPRETSYVAQESVDAFITIFVDFYDSAGNIAPIEDDIDITFVLPTGSSGDTAVDGEDFMVPAAAITLLASADGIPITSGNVTIELMPDDTIPENLETFNVVLSGTATSITTDPAAIVAVFIVDNDKPELCVLNDRTPIKRRSKEDVTLWAITNDVSGGPIGVTYTWLPHNLKEARDRERTVDGFPMLETTLPRPRRNSKSRFNEYTYTKVVPLGNETVTRTVRTYVTPTSHTRKKAPIEFDIRSTITVFPDAAFSLDLARTYTISVTSNSRTDRQLRWDFIPDGGFSSSRIKLFRNRGRASLKIKEGNQAGLYIVYRKDRGRIGWQEYIRVIRSECPEGFYTDAAPCDTELVCNNGGMIDPDLKLCTCPPGFAGQNCELALPPGVFGSNGEFVTEHFIRGNVLGKCVVYSFPEPFGVTCASGFFGNRCCDGCRTGFFGANCAQKCNCADDGCNRFSGVCRSGCKAGFSGPNCQTGS